MVDFDRLSSCFACLVVPFLAGTVIGGFMLATELSNNNNMSQRLETMDAASDFNSITGGCTVSASDYMRYSYSYSQSSCSSQCYSAFACADRYTHTITINTDSTQHKLVHAPEDTLLSQSSTCDEVSATAAPSAFTIGDTVPCWRAIDPDAVTRNEALPSDPRTASYDGLYDCGFRCTSKIGFACSEADCITIFDPSAQVKYYTEMPNTKLQRYIAILAGCAAGLVLSCALSYGAHWYSNRVDDYSSDSSAEAK